MKELSEVQQAKQKFFKFNCRRYTSLSCYSTIQINWPLQRSPGWIACFFYVFNFFTVRLLCLFSKFWVRACRSREFSQFNVPSLKTLNDWHHDVIAKSDILLNRYKGGDYMMNFSPLHRSFGYFIIAWLFPWFERTRFYKLKSTPPSSYRTKICKHALFNKVERYRQDVRRKIKNKYYHIPWVAHRKTTIEALKVY